MKRPLIALTLLAAACGAAWAQAANSTTSPTASDDLLRQIARTAIETNPEVTAKFNAFRASIDEVGVARGPLLPRVDLTADVGRTEDRVDGRSPEQQSLNRGGAALTITQLLWDGMATSHDINRAGHAKLSRWFEFTATTEGTALEALRAWYDVLRYRKLVELAEDNYVQHRFAQDQIGSRVQAGVGRGVDAEQSLARLALAESNLVTERANLHDVTERYRRIVGELPPATPAASLALPTLPVKGQEAIETAVERSPEIAAAVENLRAVRSQTSTQRSAYQPTVQARLRAGGGHNFDGVQDQSRDVTAEILLSWNLFNGGADQSRVRQYTRLLNEAQDLRDKACRDVRQTVAIAWNDIGKLTTQIDYLNSNVLAISKARNAYRQQFDIGQRSLLDLLNAENELYTAKRALTDAGYDLDIARLRTLSAMGDLTRALGIRQADAAGYASVADDWSANGDRAENCPVSLTDIPLVDKAALDARARELVAAAGRPAMSTPAPMAPATMSAAPAVRPTAATPKVEAAGTDALPARVAAWAGAWSDKDLAGYFASYAPDFRPARSSHDAWRSQRAQALGRPGDIRVEIGNVEVRALSPDRAETRFEQRYTSPTFSDRTDKRLVWQRFGDQWRIVEESNR